MTNITAAIIITIGTNWTSIGEFKDKSGLSFDVQESRYITNHTIIFDNESKKYEYVFKSLEGPKIEEKKIPKQQIIIYQSIWPTNLYLGTNLHSGW